MPLPFAPWFSGKIASISIYAYKTAGVGKRKTFFKRNGKKIEGKQVL